MKIDTIHKLYVHSLKDIYSAEKQIVKAFPKMIKAAKSADLKAGFEKHYEETQEHVRRLDEVFEILNMSGGRQKCKATEGLIAETEEFMGDAEDNSDVMDIGLIAEAQSIEHYEIASYGAVIELAKLLGDNEVVKILSKTLKEEKAVDEKLTKLAEKLLSKAVVAEKSQKNRGNGSQQPSM